MLDKILGKKEKEKNGPDLRKNEKKPGPDVSGRIKNMVSVAGDKSKSQMSKINSKVNGDQNKNKESKSDPTDKIPRPMPKPRPKETGRARLRPPEQKKPGGDSRATRGLGSLGSSVPGFGRRSPGGGKRPDDDQRTLVGAAVFGVLLIVLVGAGYYFLFYAPYQSELQEAKTIKLNEVNSYYKGALANDPQRLTLTAQIESAITPDQALAVDVLGPATTSWRAYQTNQINTKKDPYGRVMVSYDSSGRKDVIMKVSAAQQLVTQADASVLANTVITTPDTVVIPVFLPRLRAAGGLINVGDTVDIYLNTNTSASPAVPTTTNNTTNATNTTNQTSTSTSTSGNATVSGATVLAILRTNMEDSKINASISTSQSIAINQMGMSSGRSQDAGTSGVEELLKAAAAGIWDESMVSATLSSYGYKLSDFERAASFGEYENVNYMILLEVPRDKAVLIIQNQLDMQLTISTQNAPAWMQTELKKIYGSG